MLKGTTFTTYYGKTIENSYDASGYLLLIMYIIMLTPYVGTFFFFIWIIWFFIWSFVKPHGCYRSYILITLSENNSLHKVFIMMHKVLRLLEKPIK